jgi:hypothetical protein
MFDIVYSNEVSVKCKIGKVYLLRKAPPRLGPTCVFLNVGSIADVLVYLVRFGLKIFEMSVSGGLVKVNLR